MYTLKNNFICYMCVELMYVLTIKDNFQKFSTMDNSHVKNFSNCKKYEQCFLSYSYTISLLGRLRCISIQLQLLQDTVNSQVWKGITLRRREKQIAFVIIEWYYQQWNFCSCAKGPSTSKKYCVRGWHGQTIEGSLCLG